MDKKEKRQEAIESFARFYDIVTALTEPETGCPWDIEQTHQSVRENLLEETYEAVEAIDNNDMISLCEELGDIALHVLFQADISERENAFYIADVFNGISEKLVRRHPHVFADVKTDSVSEILTNWEAIKSKEKKHKKGGVPMNAPALLVARRIQEKAANTGFEFPSVEPVWDKIYEELSELKTICEKPRSNDDALTKQRLFEELGDVLFSCVNLSRFLDIQAESALREANRKFQRRFDYVLSERSEDYKNDTPESLDALWEEAKNKGL
jgi:MazG family protein